jgi:putative peptidoglycan lipid II flippase
MKRLSYITRVSLLLAVFFALDKGMAIFRQVFIARQFVIPDQDAFNVANNLPDLIYALISGGALALALIPILSSTLAKDGRAATWAIFSRIANLAFIVTGGLSLLIALSASYFVGWKFGIAPGFPLNQQHLVVDLMRLDLVATLIFSISGMVMAGLQANQHFLLPAMAPLLYNLGQIFGAVILAPDKGLTLGPIQLPAMGMGVYGLVYGVILGAVLHLAIQIPGLIMFQFHWTPKINLKNPEVIASLRLLVPRILTMFFIQFIFLARDNLASYAGAGAVSALTYGWMIMQVPETLIGTAIGTALLPTLAEMAARKDWVTFQETVQRAIQVLLALTIPVAAILALGLQPLMQIAFGIKFQGPQMAVLMGVTQANLAGIIGHSLLEVVSRGFYARKDAKTPLLISGLNALVFTVMAFLLLRPLGAPGIALSNTISYTLEAIILLILLGRRLPARFFFENTLLRSVVAALLGGGLVWLVQAALPFHTHAPELAIVGMLIGSLIALPFIWKEARLLVRL